MIKCPICDKELLKESNRIYVTEEWSCIEDHYSEMTWAGGSKSYSINSGCYPQLWKTLKEVIAEARDKYFSSRIINWKKDGF